MNCPKCKSKNTTKINNILVCLACDYDELPELPKAVATLHKRPAIEEGAVASDTYSSIATSTLNHVVTNHSEGTQYESFYGDPDYEDIYSELLAVSYLNDWYVLRSNAFDAETTLREDATCISDYEDICNQPSESFRVGYLSSSENNHCWLVLVADDYIPGDEEYISDEINVERYDICQIRIVYTKGSESKFSVKVLGEVVNDYCVIGRINLTSSRTRIVKFDVRSVRSIKLKSCTEDNHTGICTIDMLLSNNPMPFPVI